MNNNRAMLFPVKEKEKDTDADYDGSAIVDGVAYFLDAWNTISEAGNKYLSIRVKRKNKQRENI